MDANEHDSFPRTARTAWKRCYRRTVPYRQAPTSDAERRQVCSHAEHGNESSLTRFVPHVWGLLVLAIACAGCGDVKGVTGGTKGTLRCGDELLSEIQVNVYRTEGNTLEPAGFGVTNDDGVFELVTSGAKGPLRLSPGEYRFTLETAGAPVAFPDSYANPESTPLGVTWSAGDEELELEADPAIPVR